MGMKIFTSNTSFNVASLGLPANTCFDIVSVGGGGGGSGYAHMRANTSELFYPGSGGGSGVLSLYSGVLAGTYAITVGTGGAGGVSQQGSTNGVGTSSTGTSGGASSFGGLCSAPGGTGGITTTITLTPGHGGSSGGVGVYINYSGIQIYGSAGGGAGGLDINSPFSFSAGGNGWPGYIEDSNIRGLGAPSSVNSAGNGGGGACAATPGRSATTGGSAGVKSGGGGGGYGGGGGGGAFGGSGGVPGNRGAQGGTSNGGKGANGVVILFW